MISKKLSLNEFCLRIPNILWLTVDVYAGDRRRYEGEKLELASKDRAFVHPNYTVAGRRIPFDFGLIKVENKFSRHKTDGRHYILNTICLPQESHSMAGYESGDATFFGFGLIGGNKTRPIRPKYLRKMSIKMISEKICGIQGIICDSYYKYDRQTGRRTELTRMRPCKVSQTIVLFLLCFVFLTFIII